jgi:hypothetical protein
LDVLPAALEALVLLLAEVKGTAAVFAMFPAEFGALAAGLGLAAVPGGGVARMLGSSPSAKESS